MKFVDKTPVFTADNEQVGKIDRVVIDPATQQVSHLIVEKGFFFTEDKVIPVSAVTEANEERVLLEKAKDELELPKFEITDYIPLHEIDQENRYDPIYQYPLYAYPPIGTTSTWGSAWYYNPSFDTPAVEVTRRNIPEDAIALDEGAEVYSQDGERIGDIESVFTTDEANQVTHFVVSSGFFFETRKLIPVFWVSRTQENEVHLGVHSDTLKELSDYEYETETA